MTRTDFYQDRAEAVFSGLRELFEGRGYSRYRMGKFEEYDLYAKNRSFITGSAILTFTDTDGRLMALKPDVTMSVIRSSGPSLSLRKLYYCESVYRAADPSSGFSEIQQAGLECIGELDLHSVCEVIELAAGSLGSISDRYILDLSHLGLLSGYMEDAAVPPELRAEISRLAEERNSHELRALAEAGGVSPEALEVLDTMIHLRAPFPEGVRRLSELPLGPNAAAALSELAQVAVALRDVEGLWLDLSLGADPRYYSGVVMKGYLPGIPTAVLSGGRYDGLMRRLHKAAGAMGFAIYLNLLERWGDRPERLDADVLIIDQGGDTAALRACAGELRAQGLRVRVDRAVPEGYRFARLIRFDREGAHDA